MISTNRVHKAKAEGLMAGIKTIPFLRYGRILTSNPYYPCSAQGRAFSKGFSEAYNNFKFLRRI